MIHSKFEYLLTYYCAPTFAGLKPANLVTFPKSCFPHISTIVMDYQQHLEKKDIQLEILCECDRNVVILVLRPSLLDPCLKNTSISSILQFYGYPINEKRSEILAHLKKRMQTEKGFPHEIGVFLGYPPEDVLGFIRHRGRNFKFCGYWKVYSDVKAAKECFDKYTKCRSILCQSLCNGTPVADLLHIA